MENEPYSSGRAPEEEPRPTPLDLPAFLPYACIQLQAQFPLHIVVRQQEEYVSKTAEDKKKSKSKLTSRTFESQINMGSALGTTLTDEDDFDQALELVAMQDVCGNITELHLHRCPALPRLVFQLIAMCIPFHPLLYKLVIRWSPLEGELIYEIAKFLPLSNITEICLDDSPVRHRNYALLLENTSTLRSLSLARCDIGDPECEKLAACLHYPLPAALSLVMLGLAANRISDTGAVALAEALRSNRSLQYLNLCGNQVSDDGAAAIFRSLMEFPLTADELIGKRRRQLEYTKAKQELYKKYFNEMSANVERAQTSDDLSRGARRKTQVPSPASQRGRKSLASSMTPSALSTRAHTMVAELMASGPEPFGPRETVLRDRWEYAVGNTTLCALNLAYNDLGYASAAGLLRVLRHQAALAHKVGAGLLRVLLEGNALPPCAELGAVQELLETTLVWRYRKLHRKTDKASGKPKSK